MAENQIFSVVELQVKSNSFLLLQELTLKNINDDQRKSVEPLTIYLTISLKIMFVTSDYRPAKAAILSTESSFRNIGSL